MEKERSKSGGSTFHDQIQNQSDADLLSKAPAVIVENIEGESVLADGDISERSSPVKVLTAHQLQKPLPKSVTRTKMESRRRMSLPLSAFPNVFKDGVAAEDKMAGYEMGRGSVMSRDTNSDAISRMKSEVIIPNPMREDRQLTFEENEESKKKFDFWTWFWKNIKPLWSSCYEAGKSLRTYELAVVICVLLLTFLCIAGLVYTVVVSKSLFFILWYILSAVSMCLVTAYSFWSRSRNPTGTSRIVFWTSSLIAFLTGVEIWAMGLVWTIIGCDVNYAELQAKSSYDPSLYGDCSMMKVHTVLQAGILVFLISVLRLSVSHHIVWNKSKNSHDLRHARQKERDEHNLEEELRRRYYPQLFTIYLGILLVMIIASKTRWAPDISMFTFPLYIVACAVALESSRYFHVNDSLSFYWNILPLFVIVINGEESHVALSLVYFFTTLLIEQQLVTIYSRKVRKKMTSHVRKYVVASVLVFLAGNAFNLILNSSLSAYNVSLGGSFIVERELLLASAIGLAGLAFSEMFNLYSNSLDSNLISIAKLVSQNKQLKSEVDKLRRATRGNYNLDTPISKASGVLKGLLALDCLDGNTSAEIRKALYQLGQQDVFTPDLAELDAHARGSLHPELKNQLLRSVNRSYSRVVGKSEKKGPVSFARAVIDKKEKGITTLRRLKTKEMDQKDVDLISYVIEQIDDWNCDVFGIRKFCAGSERGVLYYVGMAMFYTHGLVEKLDLDEDKLKAYLSVAEMSYLPNYYHTSEHAADVTVTFHQFLKQGLGSQLSDLEILAGILACICHDLGHPGLNNNFQVATGSDIALQHNDRSVLENHHLFAMFLFLRDENLNFLAKLSPDDMKELRRLVIAMILSTDLGSHFLFLGKFKNKLANDTLDMSNGEDKELVLQTAIKCADVANPLKAIDQTVTWAALVMSEFWTQGDAESASDIPVSTFMDRSRLETVKCQVGFVDFVVQPLFETWGEFLDQKDFYVKALDETRKYWSAISEEEASEIVSKTLVEKELKNHVNIYPPQKSNQLSLSILAYGDAHDETGDDRSRSPAAPITPPQSAIALNHRHKSNDFEPAVRQVHKDLRMAVSIGNIPLLRDAAESQKGVIESKNSISLSQSHQNLSLVSEENQLENSNESAYTDMSSDKQMTS